MRQSLPYFTQLVVSKTLTTDTLPQQVPDCDPFFIGEHDTYCLCATLHDLKVLVRNGTSFFEYNTGSSP